MVADFESELDDYKTKNAQLDVSMFNEGSRKTDVKTIDDFQMFVTAVKKVCCIKEFGLLRNTYVKNK